MRVLHTHTRRLIATVMLVSAVGLAAALSLSHSASARSSSDNVVSYYHHGTLLGTTTVAPGTGIDVVWKNTACSNGYASPPVAFTWSNGATGITSAPVMAPCGHAPGSMSVIGANDFVIELWPWYPETRWYWTYKKSSGSSTGTARLANPGKATVGTVYLFRRTALYAYLVAPGKAPKKISVPAGADSITFSSAH